ncbi:MAG: LAGLIDADG family homing endonuclease [Candidatus Aenigmatarchaeota archaeon]
MRILFEKNQQRRFIEAVCKKLNKNLKEMSHDLIGYSALKKYRCEELLLPEEVADKLTELSKINWRNFKYRKILPENWGTSKGGKIGYNSLIKKYPQMIAKWRQLGIKNSGIIGRNLKKVVVPKLDKNLAEFIGIVLGDGTLTKNFVRISLDSRYDIRYASYVANLIGKIFKIGAGIRKEKNKNLIYVTLYSVTACKFLNEKFKLPFGDKIINKASIPDLILNDQNLINSCIRGLVDTDGTIYRGDTVHFYSNNKIIIEQLNKINSELKIFTHVDNTRICTNSWAHTLFYFQKIGSSNLKNVIRFSVRLKENKRIYVRDVPKYFKNYETTKLPYLLE